MPTITQPTTDDAKPTRRRITSGRLARLASATTVLVVAGSVAIATGAIPDAADKEVHLCYGSTAAGPAAVSIYDAEQNPTACPANKTQLVINQQGPTGATGAKGATGPIGPAGPAGSGSFVAAFTKSSDKALATAQSPSGGFKADVEQIPDACMTEPYTAAAGEVAIVSVSSTYATSSRNAAVWTGAAQRVNGQPATAVGFKAIADIADGVASATATARVPMTAGSSYRFGTSLRSNVDSNTFYARCFVTAMIVKG